MTQKSQKIKSEKKKIIEGLLLTGFPLEISISSELLKKDWLVENSPLYLDEDSGVSREMDIFAKKYYSNDDFKVLPAGSSQVGQVIVNLIIECKKSNHPWVFFNNADSELPLLGYQNLITDDNVIHNLRGAFFGSFSRKENYKNRVCRSNSELDNSKKIYRNIGANTIYEATLTLIKCLRYLRRQQSIWRNELSVFYPILVFEGDIWYASINEKSVKNPIKLHKLDNICLEFDYLKEDVKKLADFHPNRYFIEVVTRKNFLKLIDDIEKANIQTFEDWKKYLQGSKEYKIQRQERFLMFDNPCSTKNDPNIRSL